MKYIERADTIRQQIDDELVVFGLWECKPLLKRDTRHMAVESTRKIAVADARTHTMPTQVEAR